MDHADYVTNPIEAAAAPADACNREAIGRFDQPPGTLAQKGVPRA